MYSAKLCRSWLAGDGVLRNAAWFEGPIASKPAPTKTGFTTQQHRTPQNPVGAGLLAMASAETPPGLKASSPERRPQQAGSYKDWVHNAASDIAKPCRSRLAGDGVGKNAARLEGKIAGKPAPTKTVFRQ
jgi:hypothetical protein